MSKASKPAARANQDAFTALLGACRRLKFEPYDIARQLNARGHYEVSLGKEFPFNLRLFHFSPKH